MSRNSVVCFLIAVVLVGGFEPARAGRSGLFTGPEAVAMAEETLKGTVARCGLDHPKTIKARVVLADALRRTGNFARALEEAKEAVRVARRKLGEADIVTADTLACLGRHYEEGEDFALADDAYGRAVAILQEKLGPADRSLAGRIIRLLHRQAGVVERRASARSWFGTDEPRVRAKALRHRARSLGQEHYRRKHRKGGKFAGSLLLACWRGTAQAVAHLLEAGADVHARDRQGLTPLHYAARRGSVDIVRLLLARGADPNGIDDRGHTPLHGAAWEGKVPCITLLVAKGSRVGARNKGGEIPLHEAAWQGRVEAARRLLELESDLEATDREGRTPLRHAVFRRHRKVAKLFFELGARSCGTGDGPSLLALAKKAGDRRMTALIEKYLDR